MKLNIIELKAMEVPEAVKDFMVSHGTNHQRLLTAWNAPATAQYGETLNLLTLCLAYELQKDDPKKAIIKRIRGKLSKIRHAEESRDFEYHLDPGLSFLG